MIFKIGDIVKIIDCQRGDDNQRWRFHMTDYVGTVTSIQGISNCNDYYYVKGNPYGWHKDWLELKHRGHKDFISEDEMKI